MPNYEDRSSEGFILIYEINAKYEAEYKDVSTTIKK